MQKLLIFLCLEALFSVLAYGQESIPIGSWRTHFAYNQVKDVAVAGNKTYAMASSGLFYLDQEDNSINILNKSDGLSDVGIAAIAYQPEQQALFIAYQSGIIDVLVNEEVYAFTLLANDASEPETIHEIAFNGTSVYLATDAGVRVLLLNMEDENILTIQESYTRLSETGATDLPVYGCAFNNDSLFLATEAGIIGNSLLKQVNRQDFSTWKRFNEPTGIPPVSVHTITTFQGAVYAGIDSSGLFKYEKGIWQPTQFSTTASFSSLKSNTENIIFIAGNQLYSGNSEEIFTPVNSEFLKLPVAAEVGNNEGFWIADMQSGLVKLGGSAQGNYFPDGPVTDQSRALFYLNNQIIGVSGGYSATGIPERNTDGFYTFKNGIWKNYNQDSGNLPAIADLVDVTYNPANRHIYFASFGYGMLDWDGEEGFSIINENTEGSTLQNSSPPDRFTNISAITADAFGNLWIANHGVSRPLHQWNVKENTWQSYGFTTEEAMYPVDIMIAYNEDKWIRLDAAHGGDILVLNNDTGEERYLSSTSGEGSLPGGIVTDMVSDQYGQVWIGTDKGVAFFPNPAEVFEEGRIDAIQPIYENRTLLRDQYITSIAVDGGNRKWFGTTDGLWLFSETGEELVNNFTTENSPLISNNIKDITIDEQSGEVFITTDKGIVSYRGTATTGGETHQQVKIFPNPVYPDFNGQVGISGLVDNAVVKITSISGNLVQEIRSEGGTATWNVNNYNGQRVGTGVYLVFSSSTDGEETFVGKIAVIK